ncbi:MAG: tetratricopeptide repeat protein [Candidatus Poribacteria bacterium]|nr:tetratricopeptide repeat protein [Candidatus Poribacteria bacterium]
MENGETQKTIPEALAIALQHHRSGNLQEAEGIYLQILQVNPHHPDALHLLGVIAHQTGKSDIAIDYIGQAIAAKGSVADYHNNIGVAYQALGKFDDAVTSYRQALRLNPNYVEAYCNLGDACEALGHLDEAETNYRQALQLKPDSAETYTKLGDVLQAQGRFHEAMDSYQQTLRWKKEDALMNGETAAGALNYEELIYNPNTVHPLKDIVQDGAISRGIPGIFLNTMPKSASVYILDQLARGLGIPARRISLDLFPNDFAVPGWTKAFARGGAITLEHLPAERINLVTLQQAGIDRLIVHVRDPRQAMLSWTHHVMKLYTHNDPLLLYVEPQPPDGYFARSLTEQIDWQIDHHLPLLIEWVEGWLDVSGTEKWPIQINFTQYEDFKSDPDAFFDAVLQFYGIEPSLFTRSRADEIMRPGDRHFRKGRTDEWREVFTVEQVERASQMIPERLAISFGWTG